MEVLTTAKEMKNGKGMIAIIVGIVIIIVLLLVVTVLLLRGNGEETTTKGEEKRNVVVTADNVEEIVDELMSQEYIEPGYYLTSMSTTWHFATGDAISEDAYVENDPGNTNDVYFDVFLASDESTPILESPVIPIGAKLENIALDTSLEAGTHDCIMVYHLVDDEQNTISTLRIRFTIIVEQ